MIKNLFAQVFKKPCSYSINTLLPRRSVSAVESHKSIHLNDFNRPDLLIIVGKHIQQIILTYKIDDEKG